jgi:hypothetical protein
MLIPVIELLADAAGVVDVRSPDELKVMVPEVTVVGAVPPVADAGSVMV